MNDATTPAKVIQYGRPGIRTGKRAGAGNNHQAPRSCGTARAEWIDEEAGVMLEQAVL
jgi:hypothetical protein